MPLSINSIRQWHETALDIVLPPTCTLCGGDPGSRCAKLCPECVGLLASHRRQRTCGRCAMPLPPAGSGAASSDSDADRLVGESSGSEAVHATAAQTTAATSKQQGAGGDRAKPGSYARCRHCKKQRFAFQRALAYGIYEGTLREAVIAAKQAAHAPLTLALGGLLGEAIRPHLAADIPDRVIAVPAHWTRRIRRGGVPSQWLAESVGRCLGIQPLQSLRCVRRTRKQGTLPPEKRPENVRGAFQAKRGYVFGTSVRDLHGMHLLLIDDVLTTGSTGNAAAAALRAAGARCVTLAVLARATG